LIGVGLPGVDERARRIGMNEALFREVNDRIEDVAETFGLDRPLDLVCECGDAGCTDRIPIARDEYEALRADPRMFAVSPGHEAPDVESVVDRRQRYDVVQKREGEPAGLAEATDPRT
jgi:AraC-like DNA-binding protein